MIPATKTIPKRSEINPTINQEKRRKKQEKNPKPTTKDQNLSRPQIKKYKRINPS